MNLFKKINKFPSRAIQDFVRTENIIKYEILNTFSRRQKPDFCSEWS